MIRKSLNYDYVLATVLGLTCLLILNLSSPNIGLTWDEPDYIAGVQSYLNGLKHLISDPWTALSAESIQKYWSTNHEHPPIAKIFSAIVWVPAHSFFNDLTALRSGVMIMVALLVTFLYLSLARIYNRNAALFSVIALMTMPRFFFHSHLLALDVPVAVGTFLLAMLFWQTRNKGLGWWSIVTGVGFGLVVATKLNGILILPAFVIWTLFFQRSLKSILRLVVMGITGFFTFILIWPWLYTDPWNKLLSFIDFHLNHFKIGQWYLGSFHEPPPWHFIPVILIAVIPLTTMILALTGVIGSFIQKRNQDFILFILILIFSFLSPFLLGSLMYDNDRLLMPVFPFIAVLAGAGFKLVTDFIPKLKIFGTIAFSLLMLAPQAIQMSRHYPHLLSYYSESVGGLTGATKLGLETTYWCETFQAALPHINKHAKPGDLVWSEPWTANVLLYYQLQGKLRSDVRILNSESQPSLFGLSVPQPIQGSPELAQWFIFQFRQSQFYAGEKNAMPQMMDKKISVAYELSFEGVPLMRLYKRESN